MTGRNLIGESRRQELLGEACSILGRPATETLPKIEIIIATFRHALELERASPLLGESKKAQDGIRKAAKTFASRIISMPQGATRWGGPTQGFMPTTPHDPEAEEIDTEARDLAVRLSNLEQRIADRAERAPQGYRKGGRGLTIHSMTELSPLQRLAVDCARLFIESRGEPPSGSATGPYGKLVFALYSAAEGDPTKEATIENVIRRVAAAAKNWP